MYRVCVRGFGGFWGVLGGFGGFCRVLFFAFVLGVVGLGLGEGLEGLAGL